MTLQKKKKRQLKGSPDQVVPPEGVPIRLKIAGVGVRLAAQIADILVTIVGAGSLLLFLVVLNLTSPNTLLAIASLLFFVIRIPYYIICELLWNGQTLGKRFMKIKVIAHDGGALTAQSLIMRNLMKEAEIFLPGTLLLTLNAIDHVYNAMALGWISMNFAIPFLNHHRRRLGDLLAGTHVVHLPTHVLLRDLAVDGQIATSREDGFHFLSHQLDHYGVFELQTLETYLRNNQAASSPDAHNRQKNTTEVIVEKIRKKIGYADPVAPSERMEFLQTFYSAQRKHLEQRQIMGDRRSDKFHADQNQGDA